MSWLDRYNKNKQKLIDANLYDSMQEHDACGVGFIASIDGKPNRRVVASGIEALKALSASIPLATTRLLGFPSIEAIKPTPQASCSCIESYRFASISFCLFLLYRSNQLIKKPLLFDVFLLLHSYVLTQQHLYHL